MLLFYIYRLNMSTFFMGCRIRVALVASLFMVAIVTGRADRVNVIIHIRFKPFSVTLESILVVGCMNLSFQTYNQI